MNKCLGRARVAGCQEANLGQAPVFRLLGGPRGEVNEGEEATKMHELRKKILGKVNKPRTQQDKGHDHIQDKRVPLFFRCTESYCLAFDASGLGRPASPPTHPSLKCELLRKRQPQASHTHPPLPLVFSLVEMRVQCPVDLGAGKRGVEAL